MTIALSQDHGAAGRLLSDLLPRVLDDLPALLDDATGPSARLDPMVDRALTASRAEVLPLAEAAVRHLVEETTARLRPGTAGPDDDPLQQLRSLARHLGRERRLRDAPPGPLLSAYRVGARLGWRRIAGLARQVGLPAAAVVRLGEAVFRLVEDLIDATADGYAHEQERSVTV
jgi:hypothetical protein